RQFRILEEAEDVNAQAPVYVADRIAEELNERGKAVKGSRILALGVTYKANVGDLRESPALNVMTRLARRGAVLEFHDPFVPVVTVQGVNRERRDLSQQLIQ